MPTKAELIDAGQKFYAAQDYLLQGVVRPIFHRYGNELSIYRTLSQQFMRDAALNGEMPTAFPQFTARVQNDHFVIELAFATQIDSFVQEELNPTFNAVASGAFAAERGLMLPPRSQTAENTMPRQMRTKANLAAIKSATAELCSLAAAWESDFNDRVDNFVAVTSDTAMPYSDYEAMRTHINGLGPRLPGDVLMQRMHDSFPRLDPALSA
jgi:hypothetical protein